MAETTDYGLTKRERDAMVAIQTAIDRDGVAPSYLQLAETLGLRSKSGVHVLMGQLVHKGWVKRLRCKARSVAIRRRLPPNEADGFQALGTLAQVLILAQPSEDGTIRVALPADMVSGLVAEIAVARSRVAA